RIRKNGTRDQPCAFQIAEASGERGRAHRTEAAAELVEADGAAIGDETQESQRIATAHDLGERRRRAQAVSGRELRSTAARRRCRSRQRLPGPPAFRTSGVAAAIGSAALAVSGPREIRPPTPQRARPPLPD